MFRFIALLLALAPIAAHAWKAPDNVLKSVVLLDGPNGRGTGFHVRAKSDKIYILTNKHVCGIADDQGNMSAIMESGAHPTVQVFARSLYQDMCIVGSAGGEPMKLGDAPEYRDVVTIFGHPLGGPLALSMGAVESQNDDEYIAGALIEPGNSGSPVLNGSGRVVGIVFAYFTDSHHSIFISVEKIREFLDAY